MIARQLTFAMHLLTIRICLQHWSLKDGLTPNMVEIEGQIAGLEIEQATPLRYAIRFNNQPSIPLNERIGQTLSISYQDLIRCTNCNRRTRKSYNNGYCFLCFRQLARCDQCIIKPEQCHFHLGTCREPDWGQRVCMQHHIVYLSYTSNIKVGITRMPNVPRRWYDQGASAALPIYQAPTRRGSGYLEVALKAYFKDKTQWRQMLSTRDCDVDLRAAIVNALSDGVIERYIADEPLFSERAPVPIYHSADVCHIEYPVDTLPPKLTAINLEKTPEYSGRLLGMKGQYLLFDTGVLNIKKYTGFYINLAIN